MGSFLLEIIFADQGPGYSAGNKKGKRYFIPFDEV